MANTQSAQSTHLPCEVNLKRIEMLEEKLTVVEENTSIINKLSTRVSMLLTFISFLLIIGVSATVYTFTGLNSFKDMYSEHRLELQEQINKVHKEDREYIMAQFKDFKKDFDGKVNDLDKKVTILETKVEKEKK